MNEKQELVAKILPFLEEDVTYFLETPLNWTSADKYCMLTSITANNTYYIDGEYDKANDSKGSILVSACEVWRLKRLLNRLESEKKQKTLNTIEKTLFEMTGISEEQMRAEISNPELMTRRIAKQKQEQNIIEQTKKIFKEDGRDFDKEFSSWKKENGGNLEIH